MGQEIISFLNSMVLNILLVVAIGLVILYLKPITISCTGCGKSGMFHKCAPGTGLGSKSCENLKKGQEFVDSVGEQIEDIRNRVSTLRDDIMEPIEISRRAIQKVAEDVGDAIPRVEFKPLRANIPSCNTALGDPCKELDKGVDTALKGLNNAMEEVTKAMNFVVGEMNKVFSLILLPLQQKLQQIFKTVVSPWMDIKDDAVGLISDVQELMGSVSAIGIGNIITSSIARRIQAVVPFMSLGIALALAGLILAMWTLGGFLGAFLMIDKFAGLILWALFLPINTVTSLVRVLV